MSMKMFMKFDLLCEVIGETFEIFDILVNFGVV